MKRNTTIHSRGSQHAWQWLQVLSNWKGIVLLSAVSLILSACDPGSDSGDGIDPGIIEIPIAYIKRPIPVDDMGDEVQTDVREPRLFMSGGDVYLRSTTATDATVVNITNSVTGGIGDVKGLNASHDGTRLIFSLRLFDLNPNNPPFPSWNIYEYDLITSQLSRVITGQGFAEEGDDLYPSYLPDGRILFTSNRQRQSREMLTNEIKTSFAALDEDENIQALVLHVMNADGTDMRQISFNQSHDLYPQVLTHYQGGRIVFSRWDNAAGNNEVNLYTANPDGSEMEILYGSLSHATGTGGANIQFTNLREMENGDLMVITKPFDGTFDGGDIVIIDVDRFVDIAKPTWPMTGLTGPAQVPATISNVANDGSISVTGRYGTAFPLWDSSGRILVSKSTCQLDVGGVTRPCIDDYLDDPLAVEKSPAYGIWIYDTRGDSQKPIVLAEAGKVITEVITVETRARPPVIFDKKLLGELNTDWEAEIVGVVNIKSVYDMGDGTFDGSYFNVPTTALNITSVQDFSDPANAVAADRPARFVRFIRSVAIPDPNDQTLSNPPDLDNNAFGLQRNRGMREIVGYAPVEPDGSVKVKVPANIPLAVEVLDGEGRRIGPRHDNWFQVQPGDTLTCVGCHDANSVNPPELHARSDAERPSINNGISSSPLANTQFPVTGNAYLGTVGQTLAEVRFDNIVFNPPALEPQLNADLVYEDYWTDPTDVTLRAPDASYAYEYAGLNTPQPTNSFCATVPNGWTYRCRVAIHYAEHIHAIFQLNRGAADVFTPVAPGDPVDMTPNGILDDTCIECHRTIDANNNQQVAHGQLDLTTDPNQDPNNRFRAYNELFLPDQGQELDAGGNLVNIQITVPDGMGGFVDIDDPAAAVSPSMSTVGARSSYFIEKMTETELDALRAISGSVDHSAMAITADELKLISEWLDIGAQNFNNPFDPLVPIN